MTISKYIEGLILTKHLNVRNYFD